MTDFKTIYARRADDYDALVSHEDAPGNLLPALRLICPLDGARVIEFGAGTGRLTHLLAPAVRSIHAFDASAHMLGVAGRRLCASGAAHWSLSVADNRQVPVAAASADVALAGWSFGHAIEWYGVRWPAEIGIMIDEMARVLNPGGGAVILETMGTGGETPAPPTPELAEYYAWLENERGFATMTVRTDFRFDSVEQAEALTRFFFGDELADRITRERLTVIPEHTGLWWRRFGA